MNTSGLLQSKLSLKNINTLGLLQSLVKSTSGFIYFVRDPSIHESMNIPKIELILKV